MLGIQELRHVGNRAFHLLDIKKFYIIPTQTVSYDFQNEQRLFP